MDQSIIDRAVNIATNMALSGNPVRSVIWVPPVSSASDPDGSFYIDPCPSLSASDTAPWDKF